MKKKGMVIEIKNRNAIIMTETGEFASVKFGNFIPICGEDYEGYEVKDRSVLKKVFTSAIAAVFIFILVTVDYYNPVKAVELNMNSKIMLGLNRWNRVITASSQDKKGEILLSKTSIKNISLDKAVEKLMVEAKQENTIKSFSEIKVKSVKGNVDLSLIKSDIEKESITDSKKAKSSTNEVKNVKPNDSKNINSDQKEMLPSSNIKKENQSVNNGNNSSTQIDDYKDRTNNLNQTNENSSKNEKVKENNIDKNQKKDQKEQGNKKK